MERVENELVKDSAPDPIPCTSENKEKYRNIFEYSGPTKQHEHVVNIVGVTTPQNLFWNSFYVARSYAIHNFSYYYIALSESAFIFCYYGAPCMLSQDIAYK